MLGSVDGEQAVWQYSDDLPVLVRSVENDLDETWAWQFEQNCDVSCHHPVHAFNHPERMRHFEWFEPGTSALIPVNANSKNNGKNVI